MESSAGKHSPIGFNVGNNFAQTEISIGRQIGFVAQAKTIVTSNEPIGPRIRLNALHAISFVAEMFFILVLQIFVSLHVDNLCARDVRNLIQIQFPNCQSHTDGHISTSLATNSQSRT